jgi:hypothetical protein
MYGSWIQQENQFERFTFSNEILFKWKNSISLKSNNSLSKVNLMNVNISELNFRHSSKIIEEIDYNRLDSNGYIR